MGWVFEAPRGFESHICTQGEWVRGAQKDKAEHSQGHQIKPQKGQKVRSNMMYLSLILST